MVGDVEKAALIVRKDRNGYSSRDITTKLGRLINTIRRYLKKNPSSSKEKSALKLVYLFDLSSN